jgi:hypothetical protein
MTKGKHETAKVIPFRARRKPSPQPPLPPAQSMALAA